MKKSICFYILLASLISCQRGPHFITDQNYRSKVEAAFEKQILLAKNRKAELFNVFDQKLSTREKEALEFLYAYMPLSDLADYDGDFYLKNVRSSFAAQDTFSWGKQVPENIFRHFVLPIRVNNENLDSSRWVFFSEFKDRLKPLSMKEAALEVNHWCHEKVTYKGSDVRTSSPLATIKNAYGRCGEESTFTIAALRAAGIPARQCYTPRWAHSDDNHAWVEVWVDGKWHYMGACEPEPEFYALQRCYTDNKGFCSFTTGFGDLLVWAAKANNSGYQKVTVLKADTVTIFLNHKPGEGYTVSYDFIPPPEKKVESTTSDSSRNRNTRRFAFEDKLRGSYENTFIDSSKAFRLAATLKFNADSLWTILHKSRGNWREIIAFLSSVPPDKKSWVFSLLNEMSEKDLHDVTIEVLDDNILNAWIYQPMTQDKAIFCDYILSPRIDNEWLKPFRAFFQQKFDKDFILKGRKYPESIVAWVRRSIITDEQANYSRAPLTPSGVYDLRVADPHSRDIFFVAVCRSFGIPARLETATRIPQYFFREKWQDVYFTHPLSKPPSSYYLKPQK